MRYFIAYIAGFPLGVFVLNEIWYPAPVWLYGASLGLVMGGAAIAGGITLMMILWIAERIGSVEVPH